MKKSIFAFSLVWAAVVAWFWIMYNNINPMDYSILVFYLILPVTAIVGSAYMSSVGCSFGEALAAILIMGYGHELCYYFTFSLANMLTMDKINPFRFISGAVYMVIPIVGLLLGLIIRPFRRR